ncbi:MAG: helix-turn-helix domain-containing protein [Steroidobacteraceae bacterium]
MIRAVWAAHGTAEAAVLPGLVAPDSHIEFIFHLGSPWRMKRLGVPEWAQQPTAFIYGQNRRCLQFAGTGEVSLVALRVSPVVAATLLGRSLSDLWDQPVPLEDLIGTEASELLDRLRIAADADRFSILRQWVGKRLSGWDADCRYAQQLFDEVLWRRHHGTMPEIANALGPSGRSLRRIFANHAGLSPKEVQLSGRLLTACALLHERHELNVTDIADQTGFYDHAAFTHAFANRVGVGPIQFREEPLVFYERRGHDLQAETHAPR